MARKEDFIIMGRCGDAIMTNNRIPHISIYITAPFEQRVRHTMEIHNGMGEKKARRLLKHLDRQHSHYYNFIQAAGGAMRIIMISVLTVQVMESTVR